MSATQARFPISSTIHAPSNHERIDGDYESIAGRTPSLTTDNVSCIPAIKGEWQWDLATDTVTWSEELYRIAGYDPNTALPPLAQHTRFYTPTSWHRLITAVLNLLSAGAPYEIELEMVRADGTKRWIKSSGHPVRDAADHIVHIHGSVEDIGERQSRTGSQSPQPPVVCADHALTSHLLNSHDEEKVWISRQLTDDVCQRLSLLALRIQELGSTFPEMKAQGRTCVDVLWQQTDQTIAQVYWLAQELYPSSLDLIGLAAAIRGLCKKFVGGSKPRVSCTIGALPKIDKTLALSFFRVCEESLGNFAACSWVENVEIELQADDKELVLVVRAYGDDRECLLDEPNQIDRIQFASMKKRLSLVGGELFLRSRAPRGAELEARAPLPGFLQKANAA